MVGEICSWIFSCKCNGRTAVFLPAYWSRMLLAAYLAVSSRESSYTVMSQMWTVPLRPSYRCLPLRKRGCYPAQHTASYSLPFVVPRATCSTRWRRSTSSASRGITSRQGRTASCCDSRTSASCTSTWATTHLSCAAPSSPHRRTRELLHPTCESCCW